MAALLAVGSAQAALDTPSGSDNPMSGMPAAGAEGDRSAKTVELLLQMQDSASAPAGARDLSASRAASRGSVPVPRGVVSAKPATGGLGAQESDVNAARGDAHEGLPATSQMRTSLTSDGGADAEPVVQPSKALRLLRENRGIAIGAALALLVLVAVVSSRGRKR